MVDGSHRRVVARSDEEGPVAALPLVEAKLAAPSLRATFVDRPRIRRLLDAEGTLTIVSGSAGYGKTTAVRDWCARTDVAVEWVTVDAYDNDPVRLWWHVASAVDRVRGGLARGSLRRLAVAGGDVETAVDELMNGIAAFGRPLALVLDDVQAVTSGEEAGELLVRRGWLNLGAEEIDVLVSRTEGWPAAVVLAGLWPRSVRDLIAAVRAFGGVHLFLSPNTIRSHMRALYRKLGVHTRADAVARATALGLLRGAELHA